MATKRKTKKVEAQTDDKAAPKEQAGKSATPRQQEGPGSGEQRGYANSRTGDQGNFNTDPDQVSVGEQRSPDARGV